MKFRLLVVLFLFIVSCKKEDNGLSADQILQASIEAKGGNTFYNTTIKFDIEDLNYTMYRKNNITNLTLIRQVDTITYKAIYNNGYTEYTVNDILQEPTSQSLKFIESRLESFMYEFSIPYVFNQNDAHIEKIDNVRINNQDYYTLHITFTQIEETDEEDEFYLYINPTTYHIDYYAEKQSKTNNVKRFKIAKNRRTVSGLSFKDQKVYVSKMNENNKLSDLYKLYQEGNLTFFQDIDYKNITVEHH